jgi:hypothetical protein
MDKAYPRVEFVGEILAEIVKPRSHRWSYMIHYFNAFGLCFDAIRCQLRQP